jgi:hypothetical protein
VKPLKLPGKRPSGAECFDLLRSVLLTPAIDPQTRYGKLSPYREFFSSQETVGKRPKNKGKLRDKIFYTIFWTFSTAERSRFE